MHGKAQLEAQRFAQAAHDAVSGGLFCGLCAAAGAERVSGPGGAAGAGRPDGQLQRHQQVSGRRGKLHQHSGLLPLGKRRDRRNAGKAPGGLLHLQRVAVAHQSQYGWPAERQRRAMGAVRRGGNNLWQLQHPAGGAGRLPFLRAGCKGLAAVL